jgi:hypothetical protein
VALFAECTSSQAAVHADCLLLFTSHPAVIHLRFHVLLVLLLLLLLLQQQLDN